MNPRKVAFTLAKAVMQFWQSLDENLDVVDDDGSSNQKVVRDEATGSVGNIDDAELSAGKTDSDMVRLIYCWFTFLLSHQPIQNFVVYYLSIFLSI